MHNELDLTTCHFGELGTESWTGHIRHPEDKAEFLEGGTKELVSTQECIPRAVLVGCGLVGRPSKPVLSAMLQQCQVQVHSRSYQLSTRPWSKALAGEGGEPIVVLTLPFTHGHP